MFKKEFTTTLIKPVIRDLQHQLCNALEQQEAGKTFIEDPWSHEGGGGWTRVLEAGSQIERAGVNVSHIIGEKLPASATLKRPELTAHQFEVIGLSSVIHPRNPYVPTVHLNVRFFMAQREESIVWWFGGGFDLTPYYGFEEDCVHWHQQAKQACAVLGAGSYEKYKAECDDYFFLKHRNEPRGIGGIFFDDLNTPDFETCFKFIQQVGSRFILAYADIFARRKNLAFGAREREFQRYRRGRYVEFNLVFDRGTLFGLQSKGRTESILVSMPPEATWRYDWHPEPGSPEAQLYRDFLVKKAWI